MLGQKTGGRKKGTPNKQNLEIRAILNDFAIIQLGKLNELFEDIPDPHSKMEYLIKILPYIASKPTEIQTEILEYDFNGQLIDKTEIN